MKSRKAGVSTRIHFRFFKFSSEVKIKIKLEKMFYTNTGAKALQALPRGEHLKLCDTDQSFE